MGFFELAIKVAEVSETYAELGTAPCIFQALPHPHNCSRSLGKRSRFGVQWREKEGTYLRQVVLPSWTSTLQRTYQAPVLCPRQAASRGETLTEGWAQVPVACSSLMPPRGRLYQPLPKSTEKRGRVVAPDASSLDGCNAELDQDENQAKRLGVADPSQTLLCYPHTFGAHTCFSFIIAQGYLIPNRIPNNLLSRPEETRHNGRNKIFRARRNGRLETGGKRNSGAKEELEKHFSMQVKRKQHKSEKPGRMVVSHSLTPNTRRPRRRQGRKGQKHPETEIAGGK